MEALLPLVIYKRISELNESTGCLDIYVVRVRILKRNITIVNPVPSSLEALLPLVIYRRISELNESTGC